MIRYLAYSAPLDWQALCAFFGMRAIAGVEQVEGTCYRRTVNINGQRGWLAIQPAGDTQLALELSDSLMPVADKVVKRLGQQFDLDAPMATIQSALGDLISPWPGLRVPGAFDGLETLVRGVLGQQITVKAASTLAGRLAQALGESLETPFDGLNVTFPTAAVLRDASEDTLGQLGIVRTRIAAIQQIVTACQTGELILEPGVDVPATLKQLKAMRGIGEWTAQYAALRVLKWPDAFPAGDYGILKALDVKKPKDARAIAEQWRPWRAYAALCLWQSLA